MWKACFWLAAAACVLQAGVSRWHSSEKLAIGKVAVLTGDPVCWKRLELGIDLAGTWQTPFDADEISVDAVFVLPSGRSMTVPAFFFQDYRSDGQKKGGAGADEPLRASGAAGWRVRFLPAEAGRYTVRIQARDRSGTVSSPPVAFTARRAGGLGYIRVSRKDPSYFEFTDGTPYFALGENLAGGSLAEYFRWIPRLAGAGGNYGRIWIGNQHFGVELGEMGEYRLDNAWRLDRVMELSEEHGIYQKLCVESVRSITPRGEPRKKFDREDFAYSVSNGGPCRNMRDFFALAEAKRLFKNRLRYLVARWGYSPNVMAWELWNEFDTVGVPAPKEELLVPWSVEMCRYLKSIDPWQHLTTNSLGSHQLWPRLWESQEHEFAQMHGYYGWHKPEDEELARGMSPLMTKWLDKLTGFHKPYLWAEFGVARGRSPELRELGDRDQDGVHMHAGIWTPVMHGAAGAGAMWWWGDYVDRKDLYYHFRGLANFVKDVPWTTAGFQKAKVETKTGGLDVMGLSGKRLSILWLRNADYTWWNVIHRIPVKPLDAASITLTGLPSGLYKVEYWDTYTGRVANTKQARASAGGLRVDVPAIERDIALKIVPAN